MTSRARRFIAGAQHRIAGLENCVITMTSCATGNAHLRKDFAVRALIE